MKDVKDKENAKPAGKFGSLFESLSCGQCGAGFANLMEYLGHKKVCIPDEDFGYEEPKQPETQSEHKQQDSGIEEVISSDQNNIKSDLEQEKESKSPPKNDGEKPSDQTKPWVNTGSTYKPPRTNNGLMCAQCGTVFTSMVKYDGHRTKGCDNTTQK